MCGMLFRSFLFVVFYGVLRKGTPFQNANRSVHPDGSDHHIIGTAEKCLLVLIEHKTDRGDI